MPLYGLVIPLLMGPGAPQDPPPPWPSTLYLGNGGIWRRRIAVEIRNAADRPAAGDPVELRIGKGPGEADLAGAAAEAVRVCTPRGEELLFSLTDPGGRQVRQGPIPPGSLLTLPAECPARSSARLYVYFDNAEAWPVPDFFEGASGVRNGGLEEGSGNTPEGWHHDANDDRHRTFWVAESPHGGARCLKTVVAEGAEPSWISTRQRGLRLVGGARYEMRAWVRARDVQGYAGWYLHGGTESNPMMIAPLLNGGGGTYDWREVRVEFTAPEEATTASLGTVLRGTGTAWFDDVRLTCLSPPRLTAAALAPERLELQEREADDPWPQDGSAWTLRVPLRVANLSEEPWEKVLVAADLGPILVRSRLRPDRVRLRVAAGGATLPHGRLQELLLFEARLEPRTIRTFHLYLAEGEPGPSRPAVDLPVEYAPNPAVPGGTDLRARTMALSEYAGLAASKANLVKNPGFEAGGTSPDGWTPTHPDRSAAEEPGLFGRRCARTTVPPEGRRDWTGWRQDVPVRPGRSYLYAAWLRSEHLEGGGLQLHAHVRTPKGDLVREGAFRGVGPALHGTRDWTLLADVLDLPPDAGILQIHLTMQASGKAWHDGVVVAEVLWATARPPERRSPPPEEALSVWPVHPLIKVFREDLPPSRIPAATLSCARNEKEPLQLAVRSGRRVPDVRIEVSPPRHASGRVLSEIDVGVVGFVPVDHPSNYYSSRSPPWHRRVPSGRGACDGWPGWWPDPILPRDSFDLEPRSTQPVWITFGVPRDAPPGEYAGTVRFASRGTVLAELPFLLRVRRFALPEETHLKAIYDCRQQGPEWILPGKSPEESRKAFWAFLAARRICPDTVRPEPKIEYRDGRVEADFTDFDRAAEYYFNVLKFPHAYTPWRFYLFGWGHPPAEKFGQRPYEGEPPYEGADRSILRPAYRKAFQACLKAYWDHVKARGWDRKITFYLSDEPYDSDPKIRAQMKALCAMVHEVDPAIRIYCSTWHHQPEWDGSLDLWGIGHYGLVPVPKMEEIRRRGAAIWWTTDGQMCLDTPYAAIERLLPHYAFHYGAEAYEFWGIDWLTHDPYTWGWHKFLPHDFGPQQEKSFVRYPNGDGYLVYPPRGGRFVPSVRLEQAREGLEDYEYLHLLRELVERRRAEGRDARAGEEALRAAAALVPTPCEIGRYSTRILPDPDRLPAVREALARAIEELTGP